MNTSTCRAKERKAVCRGIKGIRITWLSNGKSVLFFPEIEELCNKGRVNQEIRIGWIHNLWTSVVCTDSRRSEASNHNTT